ncbi:MULTISPECIES: hypothetical protein [Burkholderia cepacia complex]|uniref:hypothetical protein n=1 Tax=Burkholderia cepacia complex TaxID=87882 RepID=UPI0012D9E136|nr:MULTISPECIES: hypothetical protein [Burkholderia cepacia complex]MDN8114889.1 hypothetical protein [Burkholderia vietnamiensis]HDR9140950.1 hypothetical protein [Burkholderia vietnamiensis]
MDKAESFIVGFEGDELQEGIDDLLREIRTASAALKAQRQLPEKSMAVLQEGDPRPVVPLDPNRPLYDDSGREYRVVSSSSQQVVTNSNGVFGVWDRKTGECQISNCEGVRLSNERPTAEWIARRRDAAIYVLSGMHADAAIDRARQSSAPGMSM